MKISAVKPGARRAVVCRFFHRFFVPRRIGERAFFTGYYEPVVEGSLVRTRRFQTPLYALPVDAVPVAPGKTPGLDPRLNAARKMPDGRLVAMPDRAAIETGALGTAARPLAYVAGRAEAFFIHVQGSARLRLPNGSLRRIVYAGRNGYPYTSVGKLLVGRLHVAPSAMGMAQLRTWLKANGEADGDAGTKLMWENRSFIFFRFEPTLRADAGPIGGEGLSLTPGRSLAIDHTIWPYGLPFFIDTRRPDGTALRRLMIGQDAGAAIRGRARADIFFGSGPRAAREAGAFRQTGTLFVLWPRHPHGGPRS
jgi:membrane-bound lytic murein transglycosylase A